MRVFLDTNVLVGSVATRGMCADVVREVLVSHQLVISDPLLRELERILRTKIGVPEEIISEFMAVLRQDAVFSGETRPVNIEIDDPDDIPILSTAVNAGAECFVTGDKELLELARIGSMRILSPRGFWETITGGGAGR